MNTPTPEQKAADAFSHFCAHFTQINGYPPSTMTKATMRKSLLFMAQRGSNEEELYQAATHATEVFTA